MSSSTLLVIDDEPAITALIGRIAESCGYEAWLTSDPEQFRREVETRRPDVICLDLAMPGTDGIELLRHLAEADCRAPLLIISGFDPQFLQTALRLGQALGLNIAGTVAKPIAIPALRERLLELAAARGGQAQT